MTPTSAEAPGLSRAAYEYRWLLDRGYAGSAALKLVGDKHQLPRDERMLLFRGVCSSDEAVERSSAIAPRHGGGSDARLLVDGYNQALTAMFYLQGRPLFVGNDGLTRDSGGSHGRIPDSALFERAVAMLAALAAREAPAATEIYLDSPVSGSAEHAKLFRRLFAEAGIQAEVFLERSADAPLKAEAIEKSSRNNNRGEMPRGGALFIATSDSGIAAAVAKGELNRTTRSAYLYDAARAAIELAFGPVELLEVSRLLEEEARLVDDAQVERGIDSGDAGFAGDAG
jgi:Uncharacterized conserved protein